MCSAKTERLAPWRLFAEREVCGKVEIGDKAQGIAEGIGYIYIDEPLQ